MGRSTTLLTLNALLASPDLQLTVPANSSGTASLPVAIPSNGAVVGVRVFMQAGVIDRRANQMGMAFTNGLEILIGNQ